MALQRLVFDFLGYIWVLVILGIVELIFIIVGLFGGHQQRAKYLLTVSMNIITIISYKVTKMQAVLIREYSFLRNKTQHIILTKAIGSYLKRHTFFSNFRWLFLGCI